MTEQRWPVPQSWAWVSIGEIAEVVGGATPDTTEPGNFTAEGIPWLTPADLTGYRDAYISKGARGLSEIGYKSCSAKLMPPGTVLFSSRAPIGYCVVASNEISTNQGFKSFVLPRSVSPEYIRHYLIASIDYAKSKASGTTFQELSGSRAAGLAVPVSPSREQRRIVAKIDSLSGKSKRASDQLDHIPRLVGKYKQAILAAAFRGDLTSVWRQERPSGERLCVDREGISGRLSELSELPGSWGWTALGAVAQVTGGLTKNPKRNLIQTQVPYLRVANVYANELRLDDVAEIGCTEAEFAKTMLQNGDLLIVEGNGSIEQIGRVSIWNGEIEGCSHQNHLIRARPEDMLDARYALFWLLSPLGRAAIEQVASSSSGLHTLSITKVDGLPIPLCERDEQSEIVRQIDTAFKWIKRLACEATSACRLINHLEQAVLAKAFRGELVPQDPTDEPASVLLQRIRAERGAAPTRGRREPERSRKKTPRIKRSRK